MMREAKYRMNSLFRIHYNGICCFGSKVSCVSFGADAKAKKAAAARSGRVAIAASSFVQAA